LSSTYADLSFVPWNIVVGAYPPLKEAMWEKFDVAKKYPNYIAWHERMAARPSVKAAYGN
jgi:glutathione S-transferase